MHDFPVINDVLKSSNEVGFSWTNVIKSSSAQALATELLATSVCTSYPKFANTLIERLSANTSWNVIESILNIAEHQAEALPDGKVKFFSLASVFALHYGAEQQPAARISAPLFYSWFLKQIHAISQHEKSLSIQVITNDKQLQLISHASKCFASSIEDLIGCFQLLFNIATYAVLDYPLMHITTTPNSYVTARAVHRALEQCCHLLCAKLGIDIVIPVSVLLDQSSSTTTDDQQLVDLGLLMKKIHANVYNLTPKVQQLLLQYLFLIAVCCYYRRKSELVSAACLVSEIESSLNFVNDAEITNKANSFTTQSDSSMNCISQVFQQLSVLAHDNSNANMQNFCLLEQPQYGSFQFLAFHSDLFVSLKDFKAFSERDVYKCARDLLTNPEMSLTRSTNSQFPQILIRQVCCQMACFAFNRLNTNAATHSIRDEISLLFTVFNWLRAELRNEQHDSLSDDFELHAAKITGLDSRQLKFINLTLKSVVELYANNLLGLLSKALVVRDGGKKPISDGQLICILVLSQACWPRHCRLLRARPGITDTRYKPILDTITERRKLAFPQFFTYIFELDLLEEFAQLARLDLQLRQALPPSEQMSLDLLPQVPPVILTTTTTAAGAALPTTRPTNGAQSATSESHETSTVQQQQQQKPAAAQPSLRTRGKNTEEREELKLWFENQCRSATTSLISLTGNGVASASSGLVTKALVAVDAFIANEQELLQNALLAALV